MLDFSRGQPRDRRISYPRDLEHDRVSNPGEHVRDFEGVPCQRDVEPIFHSSDEPVFPHRLRLGSRQVGLAQELQTLHSEPVYIRVRERPPFLP